MVWSHSHVYCSGISQRFTLCKWLRYSIHFLLPLRVDNSCGWYCRQETALNGHLRTRCPIETHVNMRHVSDTNRENPPPTLPFTTRERLGGGYSSKVARRRPSAGVVRRPLVETYANMSHRCLLICHSDAINGGNTIEEKLIVLHALQSGFTRCCRLVAANLGVGSTIFCVPRNEQLCGL